MKTLKLFTMSVCIAAFVFSGTLLLNHFIGQVWTTAILLSLLMVLTVFNLVIDRKTNVTITSPKAFFIEMLDRLEEDGRHVKMDRLEMALLPDREQPAYADLNQYQQVMKSEESELRARLREAVRFRDGDTFKSWNEGKRNALLRQIGAMHYYHMCLLARCIVDGVLLRNKDIMPSDSSADSSDSSDGSADSSSDSSCS